MIEYQDFNERLEDVTSYLYDWQQDVDKDFQFAALDQWDKDDKERLEEEGRPALVFDRTRPIIASVAGAEITNRYEPKFLPRDADLDDIDVPFSEAGNKVMKWVRDRGNFENAESAAFQSALICGVGVTEFYMDFEEDRDGMIRLSRVPIWEMGWDPTVTGPNYLDARYVMRDRWIDEDEIISRFGRENYDEVVRVGNVEMTQGRGLMDRVIGREVDDPRHTYFETKAGHRYDDRAGRVRLWEMYRKERRYMTRIFLPDGQDLLVPKEQAQDTLEQVRAAVLQNQMFESAAMGQPLGPIQPVDYVEDYPETRIFRSYHAGNRTIQDDEVELKTFPYQFITCFEDWSDPQRLYHYGLMKAMRDPQNYANKFFSHAVHQWAANPKGSIMYEEDLFSDIATAKAEWAKATGMVPVDPGKLQTPREKFRLIPSNVNMGGIETLLAHAISSISSSSGVSEQYTVGTAEDLKRTAATAVQSVKDSNMVTLSQPFDALRLYKKTQGRLLLDFVSAYVQTKQLDKLLGPDPDSQMFIQAAKEGDLSQQYEVIAEESAASKSKQMDVFAKVMETQFIPQLLELGVPVPPTLAKYFPFPSDINADFQSVLTEAKEMMEMQAAITKMQLQIQMQQMGMQQTSGVAPEGQDDIAYQQALAALVPPDPGMPPEGEPIG